MHRHSAVRYAMTVGLVLIPLLVVAQLWAQWRWVVGSSAYCSSPGDCLSTYYPKMVGIFSQIWLGGAVVSWLLVVGSLMLRESRTSTLRIAASGAAYSLAFFLTPLSPTRMMGGSVNGGDPITFSPLYAGAFLLLLAAALIDVRELADRVTHGRAADLPMPAGMLD